MRGILLALLGGCGFDITAGTAPEIDAPAIDAPPDARTGRCGGSVWTTDFSVDPTTFDDNGDGIKDFAMRDDSPFPPAQLVAGEWSTPGASPNPLDTRPAQTFTTRTIINVRMRSTTTSGARGAVFWINFGSSGTSHVALFVDVKRTSNTAQKFELVNKVAGAETVLATVMDLPITPIEIELDIDPAIPTVRFSANGTAGMRNLSKDDGTVTASWATLTAYSGAAAFDSLRVEVCPPS